MKTTKKLLIIKVGTSTLTRRKKNGEIGLDQESFRTIAQQIKILQKKNYDVILVSSAAISAGMVATGLKVRPANIEHEMPTLQGLASIGWRHVLNAWADPLEQKIGELLVTTKELDRDTESSEFLCVVKNLISNGHIPIINENDAITHEEISYGDNDILAAQVGRVIRQSNTLWSDVKVVLLSNIDGVYEDINDASTRIAEIKDLKSYINFISTTLSDGGSGGMQSKFIAAEITTQAGSDLYIINGRSLHGIENALLGKSGTRFIKKDL